MAEVAQLIDADPGSAGPLLLQTAGSPGKIGTASEARLHPAVFLPRETRMLRLLGHPTTLCDGLTRRDFLHVGGLGAFGVGLNDLFRLQQARAAAERPPGGLGKAKACILLFPYGSPPQHETFDPKPDAPAEVQG